MLRIFLLLLGYVGILLGTGWFLQALSLAVREAGAGHSFYVLLLLPGFVVLLSLSLVVAIHRELREERRK